MLEIAKNATRGRLGREQRRTARVRWDGRAKYVQRTTYYHLWRARITWRVFFL